MVYSINHPTMQNYQNNACFYVKGEDLMLGSRCQYFIAHVPGFSRDRNTISLESYCKRGYFLRQKKYGFILAATHASLNFGKFGTMITPSYDKCRKPRNSTISQPLFKTQTKALVVFSYRCKVYPVSPIAALMDRRLFYSRGSTYFV